MRKIIQAFTCIFLRNMLSKVSKHLNNMQLFLRNISTVEVKTKFEEVYPKLGISGCSSRKICKLSSLSLNSFWWIFFFNFHDLQNSVLIIVLNSRARKERGQVRGGMEEFEGRRRGMLTTGELCNPLSSILHHM